jgi:hypothetical protein
MIRGIAYTTLAQLPMMALAPGAYRRARLPLAVFNRGARFVVTSMFMVAPLALPPAAGAATPWAAPGALRHVPSLFVLPLSLLQQPMLYFVPAAVHAPLLAVTLALFTCYW